MRPLAVNGLAIVVLLVGWPWAPTGRLDEEWFEYLILGTGYPAALLALVLLSRWRHSGSSVLATVECALALPFFVVSAAYASIVARHLVVVPLLAQLVVGSVWWALSRPRRAVDPATIFVYVYAGFVAWVVAVAFTMPTHPVVTTFLAWVLSGSPYTLGVFAASLIVVTVELLPRPGSMRRPRARLAGDVLALTLFGIASARTEHLHHPLAFLHWGVFVGPAEMVRQGGWLLWDVPAQYGFLSTVVIALVPGHTVWDSFSTINAILMFLEASFLFVLLRTGGGAVNFAFSTLLTLAAVFLVPGWLGENIGPLVTPGVGPFRFLWVYVLLAILFWDYRTGTATSVRPAVLWAGNAAWLLGSLWACESATWVAATWLPAYVLLVWRRGGAVGSLSRRVSRAAGWLLVPPVLLAMAVGTIDAYYVRYLGHGPDWTCFVEYARAFASSLAFDPQGPVWLLLLLLCALSTMAVPHLRRGLMNPSVSLLCGAWGCFWAASSYFIARGVEINARNLAPVFCTALAVALAVGERNDVDEYQSIGRVSIAPALVVVLTLAFGNWTGLATYTSPLQPTYTSHPEDLLPRMEPSLARLLEGLGIDRSAAIAYYDTNLLPVWPFSDAQRAEGLEATTIWLPTHPFALMMFLPPDRRDLYVSRFVARRRAGGWLIEPKGIDINEALGGGAWFYDELHRSHASTVSFENERWRVSWYAPKDR